MNFKQKVVSSAVLACFIAAPAYADYIDSVQGLVGSALDADDAMVRVISGALNYATIDASVSITAEQISITSGADAAASATVEGLQGVTGIVNAISGNSIVTTAIGAVNDTAVTVDNNVEYLVDLTSGEYSIVDVTINNNFGSGSNSGFNPSQDYNFYGILSFANIFGNAYGGEYGNDGEYADPENGVGVFQAAYNAADINASVMIAAAPSYELDSFWDRNRELAVNTIDLANISITTTAIGAVNSGSVNVASSVVNSLTATTAASLP
jgi:hypothetical protein